MKSLYKISRLILLLLFVTISMQTIHAQGCDEGGDDDDKKPPKSPFLDRRIPAPGSYDPNDITGPLGYDTARWVSVKDFMSYTIRYENDPKFATAPAQKVTITLPLDEDIDPLAFRVGDFGFGDFLFSVPPNISYYSQRLDVTDSLGVYVDVTAGVDYINRNAFWVFQSIDPATGLANTLDPQLGYLLVNDTTLSDSVMGGGEGFVSFTIKPSPQAETRDTIHAMANIVFDINPPILTNNWFNVVDAKPPVSRPMPIQIGGDTTLRISALSQDDPGGVGVASYDIYVSENGGAYYLLADDLPKDSSYLFPGRQGVTYCMQTLASDWVNNTESVKPQADSCLSPIGLGQLAWLQPQAGLSYCYGDTVEMLWSASHVMDLDLFYSADSGMSFLPIAANLRADDSLYQWVLHDSLIAGSYQFQLKSTAGRPIAISDGFVILRPRPSQPHISPAGPITICAGDSAQLSAPIGFLGYLWSTGENVPEIWAKQAGLYAVSVTDQDGCSSLPSDSLLVVVMPNPPQPQVIRVGTDSLLCSVSGDRYQWFLDGLSIPDTTQQIGIDIDGVYTVIVYHGDCASELAIGVPTPIENQIISANLDIYPNPTSGPFIVQANLERGSLVTITIFSVDGRPVFEKELFAPEGNLDELIRPKGLADGLYLIRIRVNDEFAYRKLEVFR